MLILSRKVDEKIKIGNDITLTIIENIVLIYVSNNN